MTFSTGVSDAWVERLNRRINAQEKEEVER